MSMAEPQLLLLAVAYGNRAKVRDFCITIRGLYDPEMVHIAVCDNSPDRDGDFEFASTVATTRPDNPGYWGGALAALDAYCRHNAVMPEWIAITNTDLDYKSADMLQVLSSHASSSPLVIAPRITEGMIEKNPHLLAPRPRWRLWVNHLLTYSTSIAFGYIAASRLRSYVRSKNGGERKKALAPSGTRMYSPYGALIFFNAAFVSARPLWPNVPLLAEEWAIAEMAIERLAPVTFEPGIWVRHEPHQTTGTKVSRRLATMLSRAFEFIWETAR